VVKHVHVEPIKSLKNKPKPAESEAPSLPVAIKPAPVKTDRSKPESLRSKQRSEPEWSSPQSEFIKVTISTIDDSGYNSRLEIDENAADFNELVESVKQMGVVEPIIVTPTDDFKKQKAGVRFELVAGFRRFRALRKVGSRETWAVCHHYTHPSQRVIVNLLENQHRKNLRPYEEALAFKRLRDEGFRLQTIAGKLAISESRVSNYVSCVENLIPELLDIFKRNDSETTLTQLITLSRATEEEQKSFFRNLTMEKKDKDESKDKPKEKAEKGPKVKTRDQIRAFLGDLVRAESIDIDGDDVLLEDEVRSAIERVLRWVIGEVRKFPLVLPPGDKSDRMED
jgi:ParB family chromosome partitioning protein